MLVVTQPFNCWRFHFVLLTHLNAAVGTIGMGIDCLALQLGF